MEKTHKGELELSSFGKKLSLFAVSAAVLASAAACGGKKGSDAASAKGCTSTSHTEVYDVTRYDCPQYQWYIFDDAKKVIDSGISEDKAPEISETDTKICVYFTDGKERTMYREYYPKDGTMTELFECITDKKGSRVCLGSKVEEFNFAEILAKYMNKSDGVNTSSFVNLDLSEITDSSSAYERAANEINTAYNSAAAAYDEQNDMWSVCFSTIGESGKVTVYLESNGKTRLIVSEK